MTLWMLILIISAVLILFGVVIDYTAKKKNLRLDPEEGFKNASESERIYKELYLKQTIDNIHNPNQ